MKKSFCMLTMVFLCVGIVFSQEQYGNLRGVVIDTEGQPLPGVTITLESEEYGSRNIKTTSGGVFRFINITPSLWTLKCEHEGFRTYIQQNLDIHVGNNFDLEIVMELAVLEEEVTIVAESPIVDTKQTGIATNVTLTHLQEIPSARDPWVILQQTPGIFVNQENVGGSHSGTQSSFYSKGVTGGAHMYNIDGSPVTEIPAIGINMWMTTTSQRYYDFDSFEEIQITTGGADASIHSSGASINFVTRRGGNRFSGQGRIFFTNDDLQGDNRTQELIDLDYVGNRIVQIMDYGLQVGGPIKKDKLWFWVGAGVQDIRKLTINGDPDDQWINSINAKVNFQISRKNRGELAFLYNDRNLDNQGAGPSYPPETTWIQRGNGAPYLKFEDEHVFSDNFLATLKIAGNFFDRIMTVEPAGGNEVQSGYDLATGIYSDTFQYRRFSIPTYSGRLDGNYFLEKFIGGGHEFKFGIEARFLPSNSQWYWPQDARKMYVNGNPAYARVTRPQDVAYRSDRLSLYLNDAYKIGRFTFNAGLRYDREKTVIKESSVPASLTAPEVLPALTYPDLDPGVTLDTFSPRFGFTYALTADYKTILRASLARYGIQNGVAIFTRINPASLAEIAYRWRDKNNDDWVTSDELTGYPTDGIIAYFNCDPWNPTRIDDPDAISPDLKSIVTDEFLLGVEREIFTDFSMSATLILRRNHQYRWEPYYDEETGWKESQESWLGPIQKSLVYDGVTYEYEYWTLDRYRTPGTILETTHPDQRSKYWGVEMAFGKRLSHGWMMNGSFTYQGNNDYYGENGFLDPTNVASWEGRPRDYDSRWLAKLSFLYQLPYGFTISGFANAREGTIFWEGLRVSTPERAAVGLDSTIWINPEPVGSTRLPTFYNCDLSLVKNFLFGSYGRLSLQVDAFNIFNYGHTLSRFNQINSPRYEEITNILNPRVIRLGLRYSF